MSSCLTITIWHSTLRFWVLTKDYNNVDQDEIVKIAERFPLCHKEMLENEMLWTRARIKENLEKHYIHFLRSLYYNTFTIFRLYNLKVILWTIVPKLQTEF